MYCCSSKGTGEAIVYNKLYRNPIQICISLLENVEHIFCGRDQILYNIVLEKAGRMKFLSILVVVSAPLILCSWAQAANGDAKLARKFTINLDLPPNERWAEVMGTYKTDVENLLKLVKASIPQVLADAISTISENIDKYVPYPYSEEIVGVAKFMDNTSVADVLLANLYYELTAYSQGKKTQSVVSGAMACTSIVAETVNGSIMHARNMDYSFVKHLENITITVDFQKGGKTIYTGTTFAGYIGLATGQKPFKYTISLDERDQGDLWMNLAEALVDGMQGVVSFHIRDTLSRDDLSFDDAIVFLADKHLIAPCYIIMGGVKPGEGVVITRDRIALMDLLRLDTSKGNWYVLETNYDRWTTPPASDDRRDPAIKAMNDLTSAGVNGQSLYNVLSTPPVFNHKTTYTVIMSAAHPEVYKTWIRYYRS